MLPHCVGQAVLIPANRAKGQRLVAAAFKLQRVTDDSMAVVGRWTGILTWSCNRSIRIVCRRYTAGRVPRWSRRPARSSRVRATTQMPTWTSTTPSMVSLAGRPLCTGRRGGTGSTRKPIARFSAGHVCGSKAGTRRVADGPSAPDAGRSAYSRGLRCAPIIWRRPAHNYFLLYRPGETAAVQDLPSTLTEMQKMIASELSAGIATLFLD